MVNCEKWHKREVVFIPVMKENDQVREINKSCHRKELLSKDLKDIDAFFARREREEHYKDKEHPFSSRLSLIYLSLFLCFSFTHFSTYTWFKIGIPRKLPLLLYYQINKLPSVPPWIAYFPHYTSNVFTERREDEEGRKGETELILLPQQTLSFSIKNLPIL